MEVADERRAGVSRKVWVWVTGEKWLGGAGRWGRARVGPVRCSGVITFTGAHSPPPPLASYIRKYSILPSPHPFVPLHPWQTLDLGQILLIFDLWNA